MHAYLPTVHTDLTLVQFDALKRVHLIPADASETASQSVHNNVFQSLESPVSEGGENFSIG